VLSVILISDWRYGKRINMFRFTLRQNQFHNPPLVYYPSTLIININNMKEILSWTATAILVVAVGYMALLLAYALK